MKQTILGITMILALGLPDAAMAWAPEGHEIVADIALNHLTPRAKRQVRAILGDRKLGDYEVASWPDIIRGTQEYEVAYPHNGSWHFVDFNVTEKYDEDFELKPPEDGQDIVTQVKRWQKELAVKKAPPGSRLDALRFLVHFTGDMHQPLHCAYRYGDMGGNMIPVHSFRGRHYSFGPGTQMDYSPSIHSVWDDAMVQELLGGRRAGTMARQWTEEITPEQVQRWSQGEPLNWAVDSYWKARKEAYRWPEGESLPFKWSGPGMDLTSENYIDARLPMAKEQLQKAGVRLARLLNEALDPKYAPPPKPAPQKDASAPAK